MKKIIYSLVIMIAAGSLFTSCIENVEPEGIYDLREAKAEYLDALKQLRLADAEVQQAEAALRQAQALVEQADAAIKQAQAEYQALLNERLAAQTANEQAEWELKMAAAKEAAEIESVKSQQALAEAKASLDLALRNIKAYAMQLTETEYTVITNAVVAYQTALASYEAAYDSWAKASAGLFSTVYDNDKDWKAIYTDSLNYYDAKIELYNSMKAQFTSIENEPAQWKATLEEYQAKVDSLNYAKIMLEEEEALEMVDARSAFEDFREYTNGIVDASTKALEFPTVTSKQEIPTNNWSVIPQFKYVAYPISASYSEEFFFGYGDPNDANNGYMGFSNASLEDVRAILYGGALSLDDASEWGQWFSRISKSEENIYFDNYDEIGLVDIIEVLGRDSVLNTTNYEAKAKEKKDAWDAAVKKYNDDRAILEAKVDAYAKDAKDAMDKGEKGAAPAYTAVDEADKAIETAAGKEIRAVYDAFDDLKEAVTAAQADMDEGDAYVYEGLSYGPYISEKSKRQPVSAEELERGDHKYVSEVKGFNYKMAKSDSSAVINAIINYAAVKEQVLKDTSWVYVMNEDGGVEAIRVSQTTQDQYAQTICTSSVHDKKGQKPGWYAYSELGGRVSFHKTTGHHTSYYKVNYKNEYPVFATKKSNDEYKNFLPLDPADDAIAKALKAVSGRNGSNLGWVLTSAFLEYAKGIPAENINDLDNVVFNPNNYISYETFERFMEFCEDVENMVTSRRTGNVSFEKVMNLDLETLYTEINGILESVNDDLDWFGDDLDWQWKMGFKNKDFNIFEDLVFQMSDYTSSYRLVDNNGEFQTSEIVAGMGLGKSDDGVDSAAVYAQFLKDLSIATLDINYVEKFTVKDVDLAKMVAAYQKDLKKILKDNKVIDIDETVTELKTLSAAFSSVLSDVQNNNIEIETIEESIWGKDVDCIVLYGVTIPVDLLSMVSRVLNDVTVQVLNVQKWITTGGFSFKDAAVQESVENFIAVRKSWEKDFQTESAKNVAYNKLVKAYGDKYTAFNTIYNKFWGVNENNFSYTLSDAGELNMKSADRSEWKMVQAQKATTTANGKNPLNTWAASTFGSIDTEDVDNDIMIATWDCDSLQNFNQKLALALANIDANSDKVSDNSDHYRQLYNEPEYSFVVHGQEFGAETTSYTELTKAYLAKYDYLKYANYTENKKAYEALKAGVEALVADYEKTLEEANEYFETAKEFLAKYFGTVPGAESVSYVGGVEEEGESDANWLDLVAVYEDILNYVKAIAEGGYYDYDYDYDVQTEEDAEDDAEVFVAFDYVSFIENFTDWDGEKTVITGLTTGFDQEGEYAKKAYEYMGQYLDSYYKRLVEKWNIEGQINDLIMVANKLEDTYNEVMAWQFDQAGVEASDIYAENFQTVVNYVDALIANAELKVDQFTKCLAQLAAGYDPNVINRDVAQLALNIAEENLSVYKTALEAARAQYEAVIGELLSKSNQ